jgi:hypothetical protein
MSDPLAENTEEVKAMKSPDDCFEQVGGYNFESLKYPQQLKEQFPDFVKKLGESLGDKENRAKGAKLDDTNSAEIDGRKYWKSVFNGVLNYNRTMAGGGAGGNKPSGTTVYIPVNVTVTTPEAITALLNNVPDGLYKKVIFVDRNPDTKKHEFVVETYKITKFWSNAGTPQKEAEKKEGQ